MSRPGYSGRSARWHASGRSRGGRAARFSRQGDRATSRASRVPIRRAIQGAGRGEVVPPGRPRLTARRAGPFVVVVLGLVSLVLLTAVWPAARATRVLGRLARNPRVRRSGRAAATATTLPATPANSPPEPARPSSESATAAPVRSPPRPPFRPRRPPPCRQRPRRPGVRRLGLRLRRPTDSQRRRPAVAVHLRRRVQRLCWTRANGRSSRRPTGATTRGWNASRTARATSSSPAASPLRECSATRSGHRRRSCLHGPG